MITHTKFVSPLGLSARTFVVMAFLRAHDTKITLGQFTKTGVTKTLTKTLIGFTAAMLTVNLADKFQLYFLTDIRVQMNAMLT